MNSGLPLTRANRHEFLLNGGEWIYGQYDFAEHGLTDELAKALSYVRCLPFLIRVGEGARRFHVAHTDLYDAGKPNEVLLDTDIDALAEEWRTADFANVHPADYPYFAKRWFWSRLIMGRLDSQRVPEIAPSLSPTYCGYTIASRVRRALSHVCIDTGASIANSPDPEAASYGLTMIETKAQQVYFAKFG